MKQNLTVLMAVRNAGPYIAQAIESILNQTYKRFVFLIVDDKSTDNTHDIIKSFRDPRIQLKVLPENVGQTAALNIGLSRIETPWIARMDGDDFSAPTRFEDQMKLLESKPFLCCVGTYAWIFREDPKIIDKIITRPIDDGSIKKLMLREPSIIHGSIIVNREAFVAAGGYDEKYRYSADFEMYERLVTSSSIVENIPKPLLGIRRHERQDSRSVQAINEGIEIYTNRLISKRYTESDKKIIRSALAFFYLLRVRFWIRQKQFNIALIMDVARSLSASPVTVFKYISDAIKEFRRIFHEKKVE